MQTKPNTIHKNVTRQIFTLYLLDNVFQHTIFTCQSQYGEASGIHFWLNVTTSAVDSHVLRTALDPVTFRETVGRVKVSINLTAKLTKSAYC